MKPTESLDAIGRIDVRRSFRKKVIIVTEGYVTEQNYFEALKRHIYSMRREILVEIVVLQRYSLQGGISDSERLVSLTEDYIRMLKTGKVFLPAADRKSCRIFNRQSA